MAENREAFGSEVIRRPIVKGLGGTSDEDEKIEAKRDLSEAEEEDEGVNWEDKLLEETLPLVGFARMILHSGRFNVLCLHLLRNSVCWCRFPSRVKIVINRGLLLVI